MSETTLVVEETTNETLRLVHLPPGTVGSQIFSRGVQARFEAITMAV